MKRRPKLLGGRSGHQPDERIVGNDPTSDTNDPLHLRPGDRVGRFTILRGPIGGGSFGRVYIARRRGIHGWQRVVLKIGNGSQENFLNAEARILRDITAHKVGGVVPWISPTGGKDRHALIGRQTLQQDTSIDYLVLGYAAGGDLQHLIQRAPNKRVARRDALNITEQAALALHGLHAHGIIHHDLKPANILLAKPLHALGAVRPVAMLTDLGAAIKEGEAGYMKLRTLRYTSPERAAGNHTFPASDIYALGRVLEDLVGGANTTDDADIHQLIGTMTQDDPASRPDAQAVAQELQRLQRQSRSWFWMRRRFHWREVAELGFASLLVLFMLMMLTVGGASASSELGLIAFEPGDGVFSFLSGSNEAAERAGMQPTQTMIMPRYATATALAVARAMTVSGAQPVGANTRQTPTPANAQSFSATRPERTSQASGATGTVGTPGVSTPGRDAVAAADATGVPSANDAETSTAATSGDAVAAAPETSEGAATTTASTATAQATPTSRRSSPRAPTVYPGPPRVTVTKTPVYPGPETTAVAGKPPVDNPAASGGNAGTTNTTDGGGTETTVTPVKATAVTTVPPNNTDGPYPPPVDATVTTGNPPDDTPTPEPIDDPSVPPVDTPTDVPTDPPVVDEPTEAPTDPPVVDEPTEAPPDPPVVDEPTDPPAVDPPAVDPPADDPPADDPPADDPGGDTGYP